MKAKDTLGTYTSIPSPSVMRGRLIKALENETDIGFIQNMYVLMTQLKQEPSEPSETKLSLAALKGILADEKLDEVSYEDMRLGYLRERYSL